MVYAALATAAHPLELPEELRARIHALLGLAWLEGRGEGLRAMRQAYERGDHATS
jgi:hypothetical protein